MKSIFGTTNIRVHAIEAQGTDMSEVNEFLSAFDGNILDIQTVGMLYGVTKFIIVYRCCAE